MDCIWYDDCTSSTHNTNWYNRYNLTTDYTGDVLKLTAESSNGNYMPNRTGTATSITDVTEWETPFAVELDIISFDDGSYTSISAGNGSSAAGRALTSLGITGASHLKMVCDGSTVKFYVNNSETATYTGNLAVSPLVISVGVVKGHNVTIKDVKIYPI